LQKIDKKEYQLLIVLTTLIMAIWPTLYSLKPFAEIFSGYGYGVFASGKNMFSFLYVYMLGGYIGLYAKKRNRPQAIYLLAFFLSILLNYLIWIYFGDDYEIVALNYTNPLIVLATVLSLLFFKDLHFYSRTVNLLASTTIGIYAFHESSYMREFIWKRINFEKTDCSNLGINLLRILFIMLLIFMIGAVIELVRRRVFSIVGNGIKKIRSREIE